MLGGSTHHLLQQQLIFDLAAIMMMMMKPMVIIETCKFYNGRKSRSFRGRTITSHHRSETSRA
jgi:hypothetical protein